MMHGKRGRIKKVPTSSSLPRRAARNQMPPSIITSPFFPNIFDTLLELEPNLISFPNGPEQLWARISKLTAAHHPKPDEAILAARASQNIRSTTLEVLNAGIGQCFEKGPNQLFHIFYSLFLVAAKGETGVRDAWVPPAGDKVARSKWINTFSPTCVFNTTRVYTILILLIACKGDPQSLIAAASFLTPSPEPFLTMSDIKYQPPVDLPALFNAAKKAAIDGKVGKTTVLAVHLVDVEFIRIAKMKLPVEGHPTFEHCFAIGIAREGWRLYQGWGNVNKRRGFRLDEWMMADGSRVRSWEEGKKWMRLFERFVSKRGAWTEELNEIYRDLFIPLMKDPERRRELSTLNMLHFRPHVRVFGLLDVTLDDIQKFKIVEQGNTQSPSTSNPPSPTEIETYSSAPMTCEQAEESPASATMASQASSVYAALMKGSTAEAAKWTNPPVSEAQTKLPRGFFGPSGLPVCACCVKPLEGGSTRPATQPSAKTAAKAAAKASTKPAGKAPVQDVAPVDDERTAYGDVDGDSDSDITIVFDLDVYAKTRIPVEAKAFDNGEDPSSVDAEPESPASALSKVDAEIDSMLDIAKAKLDKIRAYGSLLSDRGIVVCDAGAQGSVNASPRADAKTVLELDAESKAAAPADTETVGNDESSPNSRLESLNRALSKLDAEMDSVLSIAKTRLNTIPDYSSHFGFGGDARLDTGDIFKVYPQANTGRDLRVGVESKGEEVQPPPPTLDIPTRWKLTPIPEQDEDHESSSDNESDGGVSLSVQDGSESRFEDPNYGIPRWETAGLVGRARTNQGRDYLQAFNLAGSAWNAELDRFRMGIRAYKG